MPPLGEICVTLKLLQGLATVPIKTSQIYDRTDTSWKTLNLTKCLHLFCSNVSKILIEMVPCAKNDYKQLYTLPPIYSMSLSLFYTACRYILYVESSLSLQSRK